MLLLQVVILIKQKPHTLNSHQVKPAAILRVHVVLQELQEQEQPAN